MIGRKGKLRMLELDDVRLSIAERHAVGSFIYKSFVVMEPGDSMNGCHFLF